VVARGLTGIVPAGEIMKRIKHTLTALVIMAASLSVNWAAAEPLKLRVGWIVVPAEITPIFPQDPKVALHDGTSYTIDSLRFQGSSLYIQALAAGELDIAPFGFSSFGLAVANADLTDLKVIAAEDLDGYQGYFTTQFMVRKDSGINKIEDLKGKIAATNSVGSISDMAFRIMVRSHHLDDARDMSFVEASLPNMNALLLEKKVDIIPGTVPFTLDPTLNQQARVLFTGEQAMGPTEIAFMTARQSFLEKHRAVMVDFLEDYLRVLRWYEDPANRPAALKIVANFMKLPEDKVADWAYTKKDYYRPPDGRVSPATLQKNLDLQHQYGFLKTPLDVKHYVDMSYIDEAAKRLK
jgi:sulfonate transport system substrate-binding protein